MKINEFKTNIEVNKQIIHASFCINRLLCSINSLTSFFIVNNREKRNHSIPEFQIIFIRTFLKSSCNLIRFFICFSRVSDSFSENSKCFVKPIDSLKTVNAAAIDINSCYYKLEWGVVYQEINLCCFEAILSVFYVHSTEGLPK